MTAHAKYLTPALAIAVALLTSADPSRATSYAGAPVDPPSADCTAAPGGDQVRSVAPSVPPPKDPTAADEEYGDDSAQGPPDDGGDAQESPDDPQDASDDGADHADSESDNPQDQCDVAVCAASHGEAPLSVAARLRRPPGRHPRAPVAATPPAPHEQPLQKNRHPDHAKTVALAMEAPARTERPRAAEVPAYLLFLLPLVAIGPGIARRIRNRARG